MTNGHIHHGGRHHERGVRRIKVGGGFTKAAAATLESDRIAPDTVFFLTPQGSDPNCGFVCCPPQGKSFIIDENEPPPDLSIHDIQYEEIKAFVTECNKIIRDTNTPLCPCGLTLIGFQIWECVNNYKRPRRFERAVETFNSQLLARNLYWRLGQGYIALKTLDESKFRIANAMPPEQEYLPANVANLSKVIPAQPVGMEMDR